MKMRNQSFATFKEEPTMTLIDVIPAETHPALANKSNTIVEMRIPFPYQHDLLFKASVKTWMKVLGVEYFYAVACFLHDNSEIVK
jgi:hypothetical protein